MVSSDAQTVDQYLAELPDDRRKALESVRKAILAKLPKGYDEVMNWGMITYEVPLETYPDTYNGKPLMYAALASQKNHMAVYMTSVYADPDLLEWFTKEFEATGHKLDMGKSCVRFNKIENFPPALIGKALSKYTVKKFIKLIEEARAR